MVNFINKILKEFDEKFANKYLDKDFNYGDVKQFLKEKLTEREKEYEEAIDILFEKNQIDLADAKEQGRKEAELEYEIKWAKRIAKKVANLTKN